MAFSNRYVGSALVVQWRRGGNIYTLSGDQTAFEITWETQAADVTAANDGGVYEIPTLQSGSASLTVFHTGTAGSTAWSQVTPGAVGTLWVGPQGTAAGKPRIRMLAYVRSKPLSVPYNEGVTRQVEFTMRGTLLGDVDSDTW